MQKKLSLVATLCLAGLAIVSFLQGDHVKGMEFVAAAGAAGFLPKAVGQ